MNLVDAIAVGDLLAEIRSPWLRLILFGGICFYRARLDVARSRLLAMFEARQ